MQRENWKALGQAVQLEDADWALLDKVQTHLALSDGGTSWLGETGQRDKWRFCLPAAKMAAEQEKR